jgi:subtilase family serine protease
MRFPQIATSTRTLLTLAVSTLALASCVGQDRADDGQQTEELDGTPQVLYTNVCNGGAWQCKAHVVVDSHNRIKPFATPSGLGPADLASAYHLNAAKTSTATIAIVDAFNYPNAESDLASYRSQFGLPACTTANGCFKKVNQNGATSPLPANSPAGDDWTVEAALDLDLASAACPTCKLILFEAADDQGNGLFIAQNAAAATAGVVSISNSWGGPSAGNDASLDAQFFTHSAAINTFVASGDSGNTGNSPDYPSTSLHVIGVGGTHLVRASNTRGWTETAWNGAGSSCSKLLAKPAFQSVVPTAACTKRAAADISAVADPNTGLAVFNAGSGGFIVVGGTSASSPFVAGVYARYGISGATHDASYAYGHTTEFFDITSGTNGNCTSALCRAATGWDGPTGIGSPNGANLAGGGGGNPPPPPTCAHAICSTGVKLTATCDSCASQICAADSFCCNNSWDSICVGEVSSVCHQSCP